MASAFAVAIFSGKSF